MVYFAGTVFTKKTDIRLKTQPDSDSEFNSIHFGIEINKYSTFLSLKISDKFETSYKNFKHLLIANCKELKFGSGPRPKPKTQRIPSH